MRSFLASFFFDHDKEASLKCLKKFMKGELPDLDVTLKPEYNIRKILNKSRLPFVSDSLAGMSDCK